MFYESQVVHAGLELLKLLSHLPNARIIVVIHNKGHDFGQKLGFKLYVYEVCTCACRSLGEAIGALELELQT